MNRQQRRKREREKRRKKKQNTGNKDTITPLEYHQVINSMNAIKMASLLVLRNQGWGATRLERFSDEFNTVLQDVSSGYLSLSDISKTLEEEVGLGFDDFKL